VRRSRRVVGAVPGPAGDLSEDLPLPRAVDDRPGRLCAALALALALVMTLGAWHAERSLAEGLERGVPEALIFVAAFALLGPRVGARPGRRA
jgi:hypothetical protein